MTVIFQLFCVDDIKELGRGGPERLLNFIRQALAPYRSQQPYGAGNPDEPAKFILEASNSTFLTSADKTPPQILDAIQKRSDEVSQQLMSPTRGDPSGSQQLNPSQELFPQISTQHSRRQAPGGQEGGDEKTVLQWALSCEVNNFNFYYPLLQVKKEAYKWFFEQTGRRPKGPDSAYSPFNPRHPLYSLLYHLEVESNSPEGQEGPTPGG